MDGCFAREGERLLSVACSYSKGTHSEEKFQCRLLSFTKGHTPPAVVVARADPVDPVVADG